MIGFGNELKLLGDLGVEIERPPQGCCGMAGAFGMARESYAVGKAIGERVLLPRVRSLGKETVIVADGFSCRAQIEGQGKRETMHIVEFLSARIK